MDIKALVSQMTLEEKAGLCSGDDFWHTKAVERLGIPRSMVSDGPHGLRKQDEEADHLGINDSIKAVCFPAASATAASSAPRPASRQLVSLPQIFRASRIGFATCSTLIAAPILRLFPSI